MSHDVDTIDEKHDRAMIQTWRATKFMLQSGFRKKELMIRSQPAFRLAMSPQSVELTGSASTGEVGSARTEAGRCFNDQSHDCRHCAQRFGLGVDRGR